MPGIRGERFLAVRERRVRAPGVEARSATVALVMARIYSEAAGCWDVHGPSGIQGQCKLRAQPLMAASSRALGKPSEATNARMLGLAATSPMPSLERVAQGDSSLMPPVHKAATRMPSAPPATSPNKNDNQVVISSPCFPTSWVPCCAILVDRPVPPEAGKRPRPCSAGARSQVRHCKAT